MGERFGRGLAFQRVGTPILIPVCADGLGSIRAKLAEIGLKTSVPKPPMPKPKPYKEEGFKLMGAAFEVYNDRGYGMAEEIYQESMEIELDLRLVPFRSKQELICCYKGRELRKRYIPDLMVFDCLVTDLKAV